MLTMDIETAVASSSASRACGPGGAGGASRAPRLPCAPWSTCNSIRCTSSRAARTLRCTAASSLTRPACGKTWPISSASSLTGVAGWPSGRWASCRTGAWSCAASARALYYLWRTGEVMTHHREHFERVYALTETVAPASLLRESEEAEADRFLISREVSFSGLSRLPRTSDAFHGRGEPDRAAKKVLGAMVAEGDLIEVQVEGC